MNNEMDMFSRLGKTCKEQTAKYDQCVAAEKARSKCPRKSLASKKAVKDMGVEIASIFRYYQSIEKERKDAEELQKKLDQWKVPETYLYDNSKKKTHSPDYLKRSPAFKAPARKPINFESLVEKKPMIGQYYPRYKCVATESPKWKIGETPKVSVFDERAALAVTNSPSEKFIYNPETTVLSKGCLKFDLQMQRRESRDFGANENQVEMIDSSPENSAKTRTTSVVSLDRMKGRDPKLFKCTLTGIQYDPNYEPVKIRLDKGSVNFGKMNGRTLAFCGSLPYIKSSANLENVEKYYKKIDTKKSVPQFGKCYVPKEDNKDPLPKFLKGLNNRIGVMMMGPYGLKANNYQNAKFATTTSSFAIASTKKIKPKKKKPYDFNLSRSLDENSLVMISSNPQVS